MDVHNDMDQFLHRIQNQKQTLQQAKKRQGQRPRDRKPREEMYLGFMMALLAGARRQQPYEIHSSFIPPAYLPCTAPLADLRRVAIRDLQLETHHRGRYLLLRAITPPSRMTGIMVLVEDHCADVVMLQLYQQEEEYERGAADIVNVGTVLLVKEPYFKVMASGEYGVRVDHLSDVIYVKRDDPILPDIWRPRVIEVGLSAESLKVKGNSAMKEHQYWQAITAYSDALSQPATDNEIEIIKRNRSLAFLRTKQFDAALSDTGFPNFGSKPTEKALFRAAEALYFLGRFNQCCEVLELLQTKFPNNKQALAVLDRARNRCLEQSTGRYNFKLLQAEAKKLQPPHLDHATYIGPVEIRNTDKKGRGLFLTKAVKAGDLLLCEKAFGHAYVNESEGGGSKVTLLINPETNRGFMGGQSDLIKIIVQKLYHNPSVAPAFTTLHHGTYEAVATPAVDGKPIVDTFLVERIMSFNVFGCPLSSLKTTEESSANKSKAPKAFHSCGIWTHASYINHSCYSNVNRAFIGDMMIVRAAQDLEPGTEITFWYQIPSGNSPKGLQETFKTWEFVCDCIICQDTKGTKATIIVDRQKILEKIKRLSDSSTPHGIRADKVERLLKALNNTYTRPADEVPRVLLWDPQMNLARVYIAQSNITKNLEANGKLLIMLGFIIDGADSSSTKFRVIKWGVMVDYLVEVFLNMRTAFEILGAWEDSRCAEQYAKVAYKIVVGESSSFESTYGKVGQ